MRRGKRLKVEKEAEEGLECEKAPARLQIDVYEFFLPLKPIQAAVRSAYGVKSSVYLEFSPLAAEVNLAEIDIRLGVTREVSLLASLYACPPS